MKLLLNYKSTVLNTVFLLAGFSLFSQTPAPSTSATPAAPAPPSAAPASAFGIRFSGFVKADYFYDSRQTLTLREGDVLVLPAAYAKDKGVIPADKNAVAQFGATVVQTRLRGDITGPDFFSFKTSGVLETEFLGPENTITINSLRIRHAFLKLTGAHVEALIGQYFHPFFNPDCFPGVYNFHTGSPFATVARHPQLKISTVGPTKVFASILAERDFADSGPGVANANTNFLPALQKNSGLPIFAAGILHSDAALSLGVNATYKTIRPAIIDYHGVSTGTDVSTFALNGYLKYKTPSVTFKIATIYGSNLSDIFMTGGYAVKDTLTGVGGVKDNLGSGYTPISSLSSWAEIEGSKGYVEWGLFAGYLQTLGAADNLPAVGKNADGTPAPVIFGYSFLNDVISCYRIAPRIGIKSGKAKLGLELDYTSVTRGEYNLNADARKMTQLADNPTVANWRVLATGIYSF